MTASALELRRVLFFGSGASPANSEPISNEQLKTQDFILTQLGTVGNNIPN